MPLTGTVAKTVTAPGITISESSSVSSGQQATVDETIAADTVERELVFAVDVSALQFVALQASAAMTIETNDAAAPQETIELAAGKTVLWEVGDAALFAGDVTSIFVTSLAGGTLKVVAMMDT